MEIVVKIDQDKTKRLYATWSRQQAGSFVYSDDVDEGKKKNASLGDALYKLSGPSTVLAGAIARAGVAAIKFAGNLEQTQLALEVLLGDAAKANQIKDEWTQLVAATPFDSADIDEAGKKLLAFDIEAN